MPDYISFDDAPNVDVSVTIDAQLQDIVGLLSLIKIAYDLDFGNEEVDFLNLYEIIFHQVVGYGSIVNEGNDD